VGISGHHGVAYFDGPAIGIVGGADQMEYGNCGGEQERPGLVRGRHTGAYFLIEMIKAVAEIFQAGIDATWTGVGVGDRRATGDVQGNIGDRGLNWAAVQQVTAAANQDAAGSTEAGGNVGGGTFLIDSDAVDMRSAPGLLGLDDECGLALLAMAAGEPVGRQPPDGRAGPDEHAAPVLGHHQTLSLQDLDRVADGHAGHAVVPDKLGFGREPLAFGQPPVLDGVAELVGDLPEDCPVASRIQLAQPGWRVRAHDTSSLARLPVQLTGPGISLEAAALMTDPPCHSVSVAGVVVDEAGLALLIRRRDNGHWEPPGGVLELDEDIEHGVRREVREETGLLVEPVALTGVYKNMSRGIVALVFRCRVTGGRLAPSDEAAELRWASLAEIASLADQAYAVRIADAMRFTAPPAIRAHDGVRLV